MRLLLRARHHGLVPGCCLTSGWSAVLVIKPMMEGLARGGLLLVLSGGLACSVGVIFHRRRSMQAIHAVWHGLVLGGSALRFLAVLYRRRRRPRRER